MLISTEKIKEIIEKYNIKINGAFHIGAHRCEERQFYHDINAQEIIWIDANENLVNDMKNQGVQNIFHAVISNEDDQEVIFHVANNGQSSSILELGTHRQEHPGVWYTQEIVSKTKTIDTFFKENGFDAKRYNFFNFDIQGSELDALKGATCVIPQADVIYLEVNERELYVNCGLVSEIDDFLKPFGFKRVLTEMTHHGWGDACYIKC
jgi:FkbM family methyltransferase